MSKFIIYFNIDKSKKKIKYVPVTAVRKACHARYELYIYIYV